MHNLPALELSSRDHLDLIRRLDREHCWNSLSDERYCTQCHEIFAARDVEIVGGTRAFGRLRLECPTPGCTAAPSAWLPVGDRPMRRHALRPPGVALSHTGQACTVRRTRRTAGALPTRQARVARPRGETWGKTFRRLAAKLNMLPAPLQSGGILCDELS